MQMILAVMMAAVIDITNNDQRQIVRRLFRESGNVNVKTKDVYYFLIDYLKKKTFFCDYLE
jgi:Na+/phosphate symporter